MHASHVTEFPSQYFIRRFGLPAKNRMYYMFSSDDLSQRNQMNNRLRSEWFCLRLRFNENSIERVAIVQTSNSMIHAHRPIHYQIKFTEKYRRQLVEVIGRALQNRAKPNRFRSKYFWTLLVSMRELLIYLYFQFKTCRNRSWREKDQKYQYERLRCTSIERFITN